MGQFLAMDGYTGYLTVAYGVTAVVIIGNIVSARRGLRATQRRLGEQLQRRAAGRQAPPPPGEVSQNAAGMSRGQGETE